MKKCFQRWPMRVRGQVDRDEADVLCVLRVTSPDGQGTPGDHRPGPDDVPWVRQQGRNASAGAT
eukprot:832423-Lingulodinium_polyedra.AAC.1